MDGSWDDDGFVNTDSPFLNVTLYPCRIVAENRQPWRQTLLVFRQSSADSIDVDASRRRYGEYVDSLEKIDESEAEFVLAYRFLSKDHLSENTEVFFSLHERAKNLLRWGYINADRIGVTGGCSKPCDNLNCRIRDNLLDRLPLPALVVISSLVVLC